jgi:hypothetical protein
VRGQDTEYQLEQIGHQDASLRRPPAASRPNRIFGTHRSTKLACEQQQRRNPTTKQVGISEANIVAYCDCYAAGASEAITKEEMRIMITTQKPLPSVADKATTMGQFCTEEIFGKKK